MFFINKNNFQLVSQHVLRKHLHVHKNQNENSIAHMVFLPKFIQRKSTEGVKINFQFHQNRKIRDTFFPR